MAAPYTKEYFFPKQKKEKPIHRTKVVDGRLLAERNYGWGGTPDWVDTGAVGGSTALYEKAANELLKARTAEAQAAQANPERALLANKQKADISLALAELADKQAITGSALKSENLKRKKQKVELSSLAEALAADIAKGNATAADILAGSEVKRAEAKAIPSLLEMKKETNDLGVETLKRQLYPEEDDAGDMYSELLNQLSVNWKKKQQEGIQ